MARKFKSMDGNEAAAYVSYAYTEVAGIYPITPSSPMADHVDQWAAQGRKNIFGTPVKVVEMESEAGAAGTVHGSLGAGALTTTYTASQGLLLMIPNMYKIAGEQLPGVFHVSARCVASHALNIFGDHSDVMACRQTGFAMLAEGNVQEVMDLSPVAHLAAIEGKTPFLNFFDGFRTSHEIQKVAMWDYKDLAEMCDMDAVQAFRDHALNPEHPHTRGSHENGDIFFQNREACNKVYDELPAVVEGYMKKINEKLGTDYGLFNYYGAPDADRVVVCMGSFCDVLEEVIDYLNAHGEKVGLVKVRLFRPFSIKHFVDVLPETVQKIAVMDRTKEPGSIGEPLYQDVVSALYEAGKTGIKVVGGRYGLGSKDTPPASAFAVFEELKKDEPKREFTIGIVDDVTNLSLPEAEDAPNTAAPGTIECKFWGLGGDGTVATQTPELALDGAGGCGVGRILGLGQAQVGHVIDNADGELALGLVLLELLEDSERGRGRRILAAQAITAADDLDARLAGLVESGDDVLVERLADGTRLLGTVHDGDLLDGLGENVDEVLDGERTEQTNLDKADLLAVSVEVVDDFLEHVAEGAHAHDDAVGIGSAVVVEQAVIGAELLVDLLHVALDDGGKLVVDLVAGLTVLEEDIAVLVAAAGVRVLRVERVVAESLDGVHVAHLGQILVVPHGDLLDLVAGAEAVKEVKERGLTLDGGKVSHRREVHDLLDVALGEHGEAGLTTGHDVGVIAKNVQGVGSDATRGDVEDARELLARDLVHVRDHQEQTLRSRVGGGQSTGAQRTVNSTGCTCLGLHLDDLDRGAEDVLATLGRPLVDMVGHRAGRRNGIDSRYLGVRIRNICGRLVAVHRLKLTRHIPLSSHIGIQAPAIAGMLA